jgi:DNA-binding MarR family transcriptional regulator
VKTSGDVGHDDDANHADEADRIIAAWHHERPDLDLSPMAVVSRVTRLARHLDLARRSAFARSELDSWEFDVLAALRRAGEPYRLSPGALLTQTLVTSGTMTNRIDRLTERGLVERHRCADDRRGVIVQLTPLGLDRVDSAMSILLAVEREILNTLDPASRDALSGLLRTLVTQFES